MKLLAPCMILGMGCASPRLERPELATVPCVTEGRALNFLQSITSEWLRDSAWMADLDWQVGAAGAHVVSDSPICGEAVDALTGWGGKEGPPDSVAVVRAGNRYTTVRVDALDVILVLDERGRYLKAGILE